MPGTLGFAFAGTGEAPVATWSVGEEFLIVDFRLLQENEYALTGSFNNHNQQTGYWAVD